jgi:hypothetical protein
MAQTSIGSVVSNLLSSVIILFITALIFAAVFKNAEVAPVNYTSDSQNPAP